MTLTFPNRSICPSLYDEGCVVGTAREGLQEGGVGRATIFYVGKLGKD